MANSSIPSLAVYLSDDESLPSSPPQSPRTIPTVHSDTDEQESPFSSPRQSPKTQTDPPAENDEEESRYSSPAQNPPTQTDTPAENDPDRPSEEPIKVVHTPTGARSKNPYALPVEQLPVQLQKFLKAVKTFFTKQVNFERQRAAISESTYARIQERILCKCTQRLICLIV